MIGQLLRDPGLSFVSGLVSPEPLNPTSWPASMITMNKKVKARPKMARCKECSKERPANPAVFHRGVMPRCSACRIGEMEYIGTKREPPTDGGAELPALIR